MKPTTILARFSNHDDGIEAVVAEVTGGFSVALRDMDADQYYGATQIFPTVEQATEHAMTVMPGETL